MKILEKVEILRKKMKFEKEATRQAGIKLEIKKLSQTKLSLEYLLMLDNTDRDYFMDNYFEMRLKDYLIHLYTRYGDINSTNTTADLVSEFERRNKQLRSEIFAILDDIGISHPDFGKSQ